jgi:hypothetical protein
MACCIRRGHTMKTISLRLIFYIIATGIGVICMVASITFEAYAQGNAVLIQIRTSNVTSWIANIAREHAETPFSGIGVTPIHMNGIGSKNFLAPTYSNSAYDIPYANGTCVRLLPNGTYYDVTVGINLTSDSKPNLIVNTIYGGHIINSGRVLACSILQYYLQLMTK